MFDSALSDWKPGKPVIFGWPWHGRIDLRKDSGGFLPRLTLPNGQVIQFGWSSALPLVSPAHQAGNVLRFRDPRASVIQRSTEQLAADQSAGREWRSAALYNPRESIIYGQKYTYGSELGMARWIYHDGERNWQASLSSTLSTVRLIPGPKLARRPQPESLDIDVSKPDGAPVTAAGSNWVVVDSVASGGRVILAHMTSTGSSLPDGSYSSIEGGGWHWPILEFWELTLSNVDAVRSAVLRPLKTTAQTSGTVTERVVPQLSDEAVVVTTQWVRGEPVGEMYRWNGSLVATRSTPSTIGGNGLRVPGHGSYDISYGAVGMVLAMYYRPDGSVASVTADAVVNEHYTGSGVGGGASGTGVIIGADIGGGPSNWHAETFGSGTGTFNASKTYTQTATFRLVNDGTQVASASFTATATTEMTAQLAYQIPGDVLNFPTVGERSRTVSQNCEWSVHLDTAFDSGSSNYSNTAASADMYPGPWASTVPASRLARSLALRSPAANDAASTNLILGSVRYCAQMPCVFALRANEGAAPTKVRLGSGALPYADGVFTNGRDLTGVIAERFGSYNPITRQYVRDAPGPVFWI
ncbi:hypothetical protein NA655_08620 [Pseudomonas kuykendallii]|uniref:Uncharacterized protein n=1 Tax=Pseudomonas kuykendallii TaxID=1007099 RepID=A0A1H3EIZ7_9PSED|nr:hypothetical protein [Pseudomonas kuykendallii]MCQ4271083.1 hypothetical protein [Pseudomonas kuykendallii]SDX78565.1 hypothetical protein SAMN05216287_3739 [Pseudomonas kuykendallii]